MKRGFVAALALTATFCAAHPTLAQAPRKDFIWARSTAGAPITLDGVLNEPAWAHADSVVIRWRRTPASPAAATSTNRGRTERSHQLHDPLPHRRQHALHGRLRARPLGGRLGDLQPLRRIPDVGQGSLGHDPPLAGHRVLLLVVVSRGPGGGERPGRAATLPRALDRVQRQPLRLRPRAHAGQIAAWDAVTTVGGISNDDNNVDGNPSDDNDWGYVVEMKFDLGVMGYNVTKPSGDTGGVEHLHLRLRLAVAVPGLGSAPTACGGRTLGATTSGSTTCG